MSWNITKIQDGGSKMAAPILLPVVGPLSTSTDISVYNDETLRACFHRPSLFRLSFLLGVPPSVTETLFKHLIYCSRICTPCYAIRPRRLQCLTRLPTGISCCQITQISHLSSFFPPSSCLILSYWPNAMKTQRHPQNRKVHNVSQRRQRRAEPWPRKTCVKFGENRPCVFRDM